VNVRRLRCCCWRRCIGVWSCCRDVVPPASRSSRRRTASSLPAHHGSTPSTVLQPTHQSTRQSTCVVYYRMTRWGGQAGKRVDPPVAFLTNQTLGPDLQNILRQSYDNAIVTNDLRRTTNLPNCLTKRARLFLGTIHLQNCKIARDSVRKLAYDMPIRSFSTF